jgi:uncharacterized membrane protein YbaN (DUF454 family)
MNKNVKRALVLVVGGMFIILGVIGLALPFLQGFLFIIIGLILLSLYSPTVRAWVDVHTKWSPKLHGAIERIEEWVVEIIGRP